MRTPNTHRTSFLLVTAFSMVTPSHAASQRPWFLRLEGGRAEIHRATSTGPVLGVRVGRALGTRRILRVDAGLTYSRADERYLTLDLGVEARALPGTISPVLGLGAGLLAEPEFVGEVTRGYLALDVRLARAATLRVGAQVGQHGGARGPHLLYAGLEFGGRPDKRVER